MKRTRLAFAVGTGVLVLGAAWGASRTLAARIAPVRQTVPVDMAALAEERDGVIALVQRRIEEDPWSTDDYTWLARLYLQRARETGSHEDVVRAEESARKSLELRQGRNATGWGILSSSLLEQHRFREALEAAERLVEAEPENPAYRAHLAEIQMELGDYDAARVTFGSLEPARGHLDVAPRLARWLEINGKSDQARALLYAAREKALARTDFDLPREVKAWFHLRVGDLELRQGRLDEAEQALQAGLALFPGDYRLLSAMARLEAARENWDESIRYGEQVIGTLLDPSTLALLSEAHAARGEPEKAAEYAQVMEVAIQGQAGGLHREWGLFLLDRGERVDQVLREAREGVAERPDVYGHDLLAWALHRQGSHAEAKKAMAQALRMGTEDAMLFYHAGMIERALGNREQAARHLERALQINPHFHPAHAEAAREALRADGPWYRRLGF
jgi:tetratricopeptide (TPR) repeat protein